MVAHNIPTTIKALQAKLLAYSTLVNGCRVWNRAKTTKGYGNLWFNGKLMLTHRLSYIAFIGDIPINKLVCHRCDNPPCILPEHLFIGTYKLNMVDASIKGKIQSGDNHWSRRHPEWIARGDKSGAKTHPEIIKRGEEAYGAKLTASNVIEIRALHSGRRVGREFIKDKFKISDTTITHIINRTAWKHIL